MTIINKIINGGGGGGGSGVTSFNSRAGAVLPDAGDYSALQVTYSPSGSVITATNTQEAIDQAATAIELKVSGPGTSTSGGLAYFPDTSGDVISSSANWKVVSNDNIAADNTISGTVGTLLELVSNNSSAALEVVNSANGAGFVIKLTDPTNASAAQTSSVSSPNSYLYLGFGGPGLDILMCSIGPRGEITGKKTISTPTSSAASPYALTENDSLGIFTNIGASEEAAYQLPAPVLGMTFYFNVDSTFGLKVIANGSDTIRIAGAQSSAGGYVESLTQGSYLGIVYNGLEWVAINNLGTWTLN